MEKVETRPLQVNDVFTVARMLGKITAGARQQFASMLGGKGKKKKPDPTELGMLLFQSLFIEVEVDLKKWLADLIGKDVATFEKMPAMVVLDVIEGLIEQEDIRDFFSRALSLANRLTGES